LNWRKKGREIQITMKNEKKNRARMKLENKRLKEKN
jgi:hypothetical protein